MPVTCSKVHSLPLSCTTKKSLGFISSELLVSIVFDIFNSFISIAGMLGLFLVLYMIRKASYAPFSPSLISIGCNIRSSILLL